ncbi:MAG: hypothetical protein HY452_00610, partial [Parcubacteria group bacterium]|nr:hypothetical protein [Parcubacteria group bacterium]
MLGIAVRKLVTLPGSTLGIVCDLLEKLSDPEWVEATKKFLRKENPWKVRLFEVWRTLTIGGVSKDELKARLGDGLYVSDWAKDIMSKPEFTTLPESTEIQLARATVKDLGFKKEPTITELFTRIKEVGDLCPAEVGPHLRLTDTDQPKNSWYWVAMEPITGSGGVPVVFDLRPSDGGRRWLRTDCIYPDRRWFLGSTVVFRLCK